MGKCYVVEVGAYSDRYVDAIFTTRELADEWVRHKVQVAYDAYAAAVRRDWEYWREAVETDNVIFRGEREPRSIAQFEKTDSYGFGDVTEYDLWDVIPVVPA